jgi:hypothetical protein
VPFQAIVGHWIFQCAPSTSVPVDVVPESQVVVADAATELAVSPPITKAPASAIPASLLVRTMNPSLPLTDPGRDVTYR